MAPGQTGVHPDEHGDGILIDIAMPLPATSQHSPRSDATSAHVFGLILTMTRNRAEDIAEEAYLQMWRLSEQFDPSRESAMSWVRGIADTVTAKRMRLAREQTEGGRHLRGLPTPTGRD